MKSGISHKLVNALFLIVISVGSVSIKPSLAANILVNNNGDISSPDWCTLRDAVESFTLVALQGGCTIDRGTLGDPDPDQILFDLPVPSVIQLTQGAIEIIVSMNIIGLQASNPDALTISRDLASPPDRVFMISGGGINANFSFLSISNGQITDDPDAGNFAIGGGIYATGGARVRIRTSHIYDNQADIGGGIGFDQDSPVRITGASIFDNEAIAGGGVGALNSYLRISEGSRVFDNIARSTGAGIGLNSNGRGELIDSEVYSNRSLVNVAELSLMGGFIVPDDTFGGGIDVSDNSQFEISNSIVRDNQATRGAGIIVSDSSVTIEDSVFHNNEARGVASVFGDSVTFEVGFGAAAYIIESGVLRADDSTIRNNFAATGGGIMAQHTDTRFTCNRSSIINNTAQNFGGGMHLSSDANAEIRNCTVSGNRTGIGAGIGISPSGGALMATNAHNVLLLNSTIAFNEAQSGIGGGLWLSSSNVALINNLISGNTAPFAADLFDQDGSLQIADTGGNLLGDSSKTITEAINVPGFLLFPTGSDILATSNDIDGNPNENSAETSAIIEGLADNGGPTLTHALTPNSLALDAGDQLNCSNFVVTEDQRSRPRDDNTCDIGAFELDQTACYVAVASNGNVINFCL